MSDTITLVGRAPSSRHLIEKLGADDTIYTIAACWDLPQHIDACVEIHPYWLLKHKNYAHSMFKWMQKPHDFPLYMQETHADIPASAVFPFDEVVNLAPVLRGDKDKQNRFLSSSFDYLMALAILQEPKRINVLGFDMASDTEFRYQREGAAFWCGVAAGAGIEVWLPDESPMLAVDMLYGYEGAQAITEERLKRLVGNYEDWIKEAQERLQAASDALPKVSGVDMDDETRALYQAAIDARDFLYVLSGGVQTVEQLLSNYMVEDIVYRQMLETQRAVAVASVQTKLSWLNFWEGLTTDRQARFKKYRDEDHDRWLGELQEAHRQKAKARDEYMTWKGGQQVLSQLIRECDFQYNDEWKPSAETLSEAVEV